jgi:hypothetical protein
MLKVGVLSGLLFLGLVLSQTAPGMLGAYYAHLGLPLRILTMTALAFIMIRVGLDFDMDKRLVGSYAYDYWVAMTAAAFPWLLCTLYFVLVMAPPPPPDGSSVWLNMLLLSRFAAPTSAGVLFAMLTAAGLGATWVFRKARVLAIFDDVDTILAITLLQMVMVGIAWQLVVAAGFTVLLVWVAWRFLRTFHLPRSWLWTMVYAAALTVTLESIAGLNHYFDATVPLRIEVLLPAFVLGCTMARSPLTSRIDATPDNPMDQHIGDIVTACFLFLVGLSMPLIPSIHGSPIIEPGATAIPETSGLGTMAIHVMALTTLSNLGKMFPALCYRRIASRRERLALAVSMFPRGEVGAGVLVISFTSGIAGAPLTAATLSLALNLICTGLFIVIVKRLLGSVPPDPQFQSVSVYARPVRAMRGNDPFRRPDRGEKP